MRTARFRSSVPSLALVLAFGCCIMHVAILALEPDVPWAKFGGSAFWPPKPSTPETPKSLNPNSKLRNFGPLTP